MKKIVLIFMTSLFILGCNSKTEKEVKSTKIKVVKKPKDSLELKVIATCNCKIKKYFRYYNKGLMFHKFGNSNAKYKSDLLFKKWSNDSLVSKVKSITFHNFDSIPSKFSVFKQVEKIYIINSDDGIYGINVFKKLKSIEFFGSRINLKKNNKWLHRIEALFADKSTFFGLDSFKKMSNLKVIKFAYSRFDVFPKDLDELRCLQEISLVGSLPMKNLINLDELDFSKNKCLRKVEFTSWFRSFKGIPKGISNSNIRELEIFYPTLTEIEKKELKKIKASL